ncbi:hypothetical protein PC116_g23212 [Phytophthora cactorum]|uniref:Uncharacterized protein n=1 Tax=Phytophthora cactorum TaxID=29920 RepID=A0A8T1JY08_9STRA|nr:hypothetical protein Pcac1_g17838 [Phytophthora cactorum]KAG2883147.1 hypothetical protein PC117_g26087 [Phytophthora cactorum]KAG3002139.1 hypothetical protein PC120_g19894 [Phytophthora cactorum]KAG3127874.1 hypothetical protein PC128_g27042 [Phytophthora cactorum]KAG4036819.1 hypothetical protein PC123_g27613 [Phytophthora cactorum]
MLSHLHAPNPAPVDVLLNIPEEIVLRGLLSR